MVICHLVKIEKRNVKIRHYNINILFIYIVSSDRVPEIENDHFDHDHFDHFCVLYDIEISLS